MQLVIYLLGGLIGLYLLITLIFTYSVQQFPRNPVSDPPDWGRVIDTKIPAIDGGLLEVWRIEPQGASRGLIVFAHGWGRNRDRMVSRARILRAGDLRRLFTAPEITGAPAGEGS